MLQVEFHVTFPSFSCLSFFLLNSKWNKSDSWFSKRSEKSKRRTKTLANTNDPKWNQTFIYDGIRWSELRKRALEITVWDYGKYDTNDFLGETVLELATARLDEEPEWHPLTGHGEHRHIGYVESAR